MKKQTGYFSCFISIVAALFAYAMHKNGGSITGPFIFGDECEYFSYARDLFRGADLSRHTQYGVLYPALASLFFNLGDPKKIYDAIRWFNIALLISSAIPAFLLARMLLPKSPALFLFPVFVMTAPFGGLGYLIWAEPLYYLLFLWTACTLLRFYRQPGIAVGGVCGVLLALLFHVKPGAGIVVQIAASLSCAAWIAVTPSGSRKPVVPYVVAVGLSCAMLTIPWIVRNLSLGAGPIGYKYAFVELASVSAEFGYMHFLKEALLSVFYQSAYVFIGTFGLLGVLFVLLATRWRTYSPELIAFIVFVIGCIAGLVALAAIGTTAERTDGYWVPLGRYYDAISPIPVLLSVYLLIQDSTPTRHERIWLVLTTIALMAVVVFATPLKMTRPISFIDRPELALPIWIVDAGNVVWRDRYDPSILERICFAGTFGLIGLLLILTAKWRRAFLAAVTLVFIGSFATALAEHRYVRIIGSCQAEMNDVVNFLYHQKVANNRVVFDSELKNTNTANLMNFWTANDQVKYLSQAEFVDPANLSGQGFFVTTQHLLYPVAYRSGGLVVYRPVQ